MPRGQWPAPGDGRPLAGREGADRHHDLLQPLALVASGRQGLTVTAVNRAAFAAGVRRGQALADARAVLPSLASRPAEPERDRAALAALAGWVGRYGPARNVEGEDGLWVDTTGVAHLYGGEAAMLRDLHQRLRRAGYTARIALAATPGAAYALARFAAHAGRPWLTVAEGRTAAALAALPVAALRLDAAALTLLRRLGLKEVGQLYRLPRDSLARRFRSRTVAGQLVERLDAALGLRAEPREGLAEPPELAARQTFAEPLISSDGLVTAIAALGAELCARLADAGRGLSRARVMLYRADGTSAGLAVGTAAPVRDPGHLMALLAGKLDGLDAGFGIDLIVFEALESAALAEVQPALSGPAGAAAVPGQGAADAAARLIDRLAARLGPRAVQCLAPADSHRPEQVAARRSWLADGIGRRAPDVTGRGPTGEGAGTAERPPFLLERPEPIAVMAEVPDGPPLRFTWRRVEHRTARAEGPERIEPEWWRGLPSRSAPAGARPSSPGDDPAAALGALVPPPAPLRPRDYYRVEDDRGGRFWVFRDGLYERTRDEGEPRWFMHGLFG